MAGALVLALVAGVVAVIDALTGPLAADRSGGQDTRSTSRAASLTGDTVTPIALSGLGPRTRGAIPRESAQVLVVTGDGAKGTASTIQLFRRSGSGWAAGPVWHGHNGAHGWTDDHREGDLRTPVGVFTLSDAGGRKKDPGAKLPYHRSEAFRPTGDGVYGDSLEGSFDYVIAIDYNRRPGTSPLDPTRPEGAERGGGIWLHVDHEGPTHGCISVPAAGMKALLRELDPASRPVVVMGDRDSLAA